MHWHNAEEIRKILPHCDSRAFDLEVYKAAGYFVLRQAIPQETVFQWQVSWQNFRNRHLNRGRNLEPTHPVSVQETESIQDTCSTDVKEFINITHSPLLLDLAQEIYGPDLGVYHWRFLMKDQYARKPVSLHQDFGYNIGWPDKTSFLIPFSPVNAENGGMFFYPGSHAFGYLGGAGRINTDSFGDWPAVCPEINPGDIILMHCLTWHGSTPHVNGPDRVMMQIVYQPADDPSTQTLVRGQWKTNAFYDLAKRRKYFSLSYVTQLNTLHAEMRHTKDIIQKAINITEPDALQAELRHIKDTIEQGIAKAEMPQ
jgi:hypothetical protein